MKSYHGIKRIFSVFGFQDFPNKFTVSGSYRVEILPSHCLTILPSHRILQSYRRTNSMQFYRLKIIQSHQLTTEPFSSPCSPILRYQKLDNPERCSQLHCTTLQRASEHNLRNPSITPHTSNHDEGCMRRQVRTISSSISCYQADRPPAKRGPAR